MNQMDAKWTLLQINSSFILSEDPEANMILLWEM